MMRLNVALWVLLYAPLCVLADDARLEVVERGQLRDIGSGLYDDYPIAKCDSKGNIWMTCLAFDAKAKSEKIIFRKFDGQEWSEPSEVGAAGQMFAPALAVNDSAQWAAWSQRDGDNWEIYARQIGPAIGEAIKVTTSDSVDRNVSATITASGKVWVAWQSDRAGNNDIYAAVINGLQAAPIQISTYKGSDYNPCILALGETIYIAWDSYRNGNYDVFMKVIQDGRVGELLQISDSPDTDKHPALSVDDKGRLWITYNNSKNMRPFLSKMAHKGCEIRCYENDRLYKPSAIKTKVVATPQEGEEFPVLTVSAESGTRMLCIATKYDQRCWLFVGRTLSGDQWSQPELITPPFTICRRPSIVRLKNGEFWLIGVSTDRLWSSKRNANVPGTSTVVVVSLPSLSEQEKIPPVLEEVSLNKPSVPEIVAKGRQVLEYQGKSFNLYFGDLHAHSNISLCACQNDPLPDDLYSYSRDSAGSDFMAMTDHGAHMNDYDFHVTKKLANANNQPDIFVALMAQEWSSARTRGKGYGHKNIIYLNDNPSHYFNPHKESILPKPYSNADPTELWAALSNEDAITIPHQLADAEHGAYTDWSYKNEQMQPVAEIFQTRGSYEFPLAPRAADAFQEGASLQDAWLAGHIIGVIASPDHGMGPGRAVILAENLTRKSIFEALKKRRCYGTTLAPIYLDFRINGHLMGEEISVKSATEPRTITMKVYFKNLYQMVLYRNNEEALRETIFKGKFEREYIDRAELDTDRTNWYYMRVEGRAGQHDAQDVAWSSPIWVRVNK